MQVQHRTHIDGSEVEIQLQRLSSLPPSWAVQQIEACVESWVALLVVFSLVYLAQNRTALVLLGGGSAVLQADNILVGAQSSRKGGRQAPLVVAASLLTLFACGVVGLVGVGRPLVRYYLMMGATTTATEVRLRASAGCPCASSSHALST